MSKRVRFNEENVAHKKARSSRTESSNVSENLKSDDIRNTSKPSRLKGNNTIESDEEEIEENQQKKFDVLNEEDIEGAEDGEDGEIGDKFKDDMGTQITPFNLKEEMTEGDFDRQGHYHFKKDNDIRDNWMDDINWSEVAKKSSKNPTKNINFDDEDLINKDFDELTVLQEIKEYLNPKESVQSAMRRLGGSSNNSKSKKTRSWKSERAYDLEDDGESEEEKEVDDEIEVMKKKFLDLTEKVDQMAGAGFYDIYTDTYEKISFRIKKLKPSAAEDLTDIFANDFDNKSEQQVSQEQDKSSSASSVSAAAAGDATTSIMWEYKWSSSQDQLYGPFSTKQMMHWKEKNYFQPEVMVRKLTEGEKGTFYAIGRVDFDLYDD